MATDWGLTRKLTFGEARLEQLQYWRGQTVPERLASMTALTKRMQAMRGIDTDELKRDWTVRRIRRGPG